MKTKDLPKVTAGQVLGSDGLLSDTAGRGTALLTLDEAMKFLDGKRGYHSNPNLLINADFRKPVNRNGQSEYTATGFTIDMWQMFNATLNIEDENIAVFAPQTASNSHLVYYFRDIPNGKTITISVLVDELSGSCNLGGFGGSITLKNGLNVFTQTVPVDYQYNYIYFLNYLKGSIKLKAAKLELGNQQTLAHKDADGNWVLNEPPNYDLQYALCSQYSPSTGDFVGNQHSNENLLDNWYLAKPVNQRSKNQYTDGYGLDRWFGQKNARIKVLDDRVQFYSGDTNYSSILQKIENPPAIGEVCTLSFLLANNVLVTKTAALNANPSLGIIRNYNGNVFRAYGSNVEVVAYAAHSSAENPIEIIAVKYELGSVQTLAHKEGDTWVLNDPPPNQALELAKCQRYQIVLTERLSIRATTAGTAYMDFDIPIPTTLAKTPIIVGTSYTITAYGGATITGGTLSVVMHCPGNVRLRYTKENHGQTDGTFSIPVNAKMILDANL